MTIFLDNPSVVELNDWLCQNYESQFDTLLANFDTVLDVDNFYIQWRSALWDILEVVAQEKGYPNGICLLATNPPSKSYADHHYWVVYHVLNYLLTEL